MRRCLCELNASTHTAEVRMTSGLGGSTMPRRIQEMAGPTMSPRNFRVRKTKMLTLIQSEKERKRTYCDGWSWWTGGGAVEISIDQPEIGCI